MLRVTTNDLSIEHLATGDEADRVVGGGGFSLQLGNGFGIRVGGHHHHPHPGFPGRYPVNPYVPGFNPYSPTFGPAPYVPSPYFPMPYPRPRHPGWCGTP